MKIRIALVVVVISFCSCIMTNNSYMSKDIRILVSDDTDLDVVAGAIQLDTTIGSNLVYSVHFDKVNGGEKIFLGVSIDEHNGYKSPRLKVFQEDNENRYSINEIMEFPYSLMGRDTIYQLPEQL